LRVPFGDKSCLVLHHNAMFILLVPVDPLSANHILVLGALHQLPHLISCEVVELILHSQDPIRFPRASSIVVGSTKETKACCLQNEAYFLRRVLVPPLGSPNTRSIGWFLKSLYAFQML
jgi:hypothetical protein